MASPRARNARVVAQPAAASVRAAPHVRAVNLQLGGVWAQMHHQSVQHCSSIAQLEENNSALTTELQSREVALDAYKEKVRVRLPTQHSLRRGEGFSGLRQRTPRQHSAHESTSRRSCHVDTPTLDGCRTLIHVHIAPPGKRGLGLQLSTGRL